MTSLPFSARSRPDAARLAQRALNRAIPHVAGTPGHGKPAAMPATGLKRRTDVTDHNRAWSLPHVTVTPAVVAPVTLSLLAAALLLDTLWQGATFLQGHVPEIRTLLQGVMLAGLAGLWTQVRQLQTRQTRDSDLARQDELTGLPNRRALNEQLQSLMGGRGAGQRGNGQQDMGREGFPGSSDQTWSVLLIDIDHFKAVNDTHGHQAGDEVLRAVTTSLRQELREGDVLGRWGGEEFLALLPATGLEGALVAAERLRRAVSLRTFPYAGSVTVSIGAASALPSDHLERVVARADAGMYRAKRAGRNRVAFSD